MKKIFILLFLLPLLSKAQVYQAMPQAGYGPVKRMIFDSVLTLPLGITKVQNITGGRDTGQLRYNKADSSLYTYSGSAFRKVSGTGGSTDTTSLSNRINLKLNAVDTVSLSNRINSKLSLAGGTMTGNILTGDPDNDNGNTIGNNFIYTTYLNAYTPENNTALVATSDGGNHATFGGSQVIINNSGKLTSVDTLIGTAIKRTSGTSAQYLMANGSISTIGSGLSLSGGVLSNTATPTPVGYYGAFQDNTIQTAAAINTPYAMKFGVTDLSNEVSIVSDGSNLTRITIANTGIYNIQFSAQFDRTNSGTDVVDIWLRKNGVDVPGTGGKIVLAGSAIASAIIATWNYVLDITAGDYYQLMWSSPDTHVRILYEPAQTSPFAHPLIPSTILTVTQQSGIMAGTGITAINSFTGAAQTMVTGTDSLDFKIVSSGTQHKFNIPSASTTARGVITTSAQTMAGGKTFTLGNQVAGWGAIGISDNNDTENNYAGIKGQGLQSSKGVWGTATDGIGVYGTSTNSAGIVAQSTSGYHAVLGDFSSNSTYITNSGRVLIKTNVDNTLDALQVNGNIKADNTRYIIKSAGAANSTTTLNSFDLNTPTLTAGTYRFSILIAYNAATTGTGARFVIDGTGTAPTSLNFSNFRTLTNIASVQSYGSAYNIPSSASVSSLTTGNICKIEGVITLPSTAVLSVKFASSSTNTITVLAGSYFEYF